VHTVRYCAYLYINDGTWRYGRFYFRYTGGSANAPRRQLKASLTLMLIRRMRSGIFHSGMRSEVGVVKGKEISISKSKFNYY
jgi:hypothetical protein